MLSRIESCFVSLLRGTVVFTAFISIFVAIAALIYAAYAQYAPEPSARLSGRMPAFIEATDPAKLFKQLFPADSEIVTQATSLTDNVRYSFQNASNEQIFAEFNRFLDSFLGGSFQSQRQFNDWVYGNDRIEFTWSKDIDNERATNEDNVNILWKSLIIDYAQRLTVRAQLLSDSKKKNLYSSSFDRLTAPTGRSRAPYFLVWYFDSVQAVLRQVQQELLSAKIERNALRLTVPISLYVASAAFGYFILIMFLFLVVSMEASLRRVAEARINSPNSEANDQRVANDPSSSVAAAESSPA